MARRSNQELQVNRNFSFVLNSSGGFFDDWDEINFGKIDNNLNIYRVDRNPRAPSSPILEVIEDSDETDSTKHNSKVDTNYSFIGKVLVVDDDDEINADVIEN